MNRWLNLVCQKQLHGGLKVFSLSLNPWFSNSINPWYKHLSHEFNSLDHPEITGRERSSTVSLVENHEQGVDGSEHIVLSSYLHIWTMSNRMNKLWSMNLEKTTTWKIKNVPSLSMIQTTTFKLKALPDVKGECNVNFQVFHHYTTFSQWNLSKQCWNALCR